MVRKFVVDVTFKQNPKSTNAGLFLRWCFCWDRAAVFEHLAHAFAVRTVRRFLQIGFQLLRCRGGFLLPPVDFCQNQVNVRDLMRISVHQKRGTFRIFQPALRARSNSFRAFLGIRYSRTPITGCSFVGDGLFGTSSMSMTDLAGEVSISTAEDIYPELSAEIM